MAAGAKRASVPAAMVAALCVSMAGLSAAEFTPTSELTLPTLGQYRYFGAAVAFEEDVLAVGAPKNLSSSGYGAGVAYVFQRKGSGTGPWQLVKRLTSGRAPEEKDGFGEVLALSGTHLVVGVPGETVGENRSQGAVYLYDRDEGGLGQWGLVAKLMVTGGSASDQFGASLALAGDELVVGAPGINVATGGMGAVYLFQRTAGATNTWSLKKRLFPTEGLAVAFGGAAALEGNVLVVGAYMSQVGTNTQGAAYVFERDAGGRGNWGEFKRLIAKDGARGDRFGASVALSGETILVGAPYKKNGTNSQQGAVYVYQRQFSPRWWAQVGKILPTESSAYARFGAALALRGHIALIGAYQDLVNTNNVQGAIYLCSRHAGLPFAFQPTQRVVLPEGRAEDYFGWAMAMSDSEFVIGVPYRDVGGDDDQGTVQFFTYSAQGTAQAQGGELTGPGLSSFAEAAAYDDWLGNSVALSGDLAMAGVPYDAVDSNMDQGTVCLFAAESATQVDPAYLGLLTIADSLVFGYAVAADETTLVVGAPMTTVGKELDAGAAYVFERSSSTPPRWSATGKLVASDSQVSADFGEAVALASDIIAVGAPGAHTSGSIEQPGAAYLFGRRGAEWTEIQKLWAPDGAHNDAFGNALALDGSVLAIGAPENGQEGAVYVFTNVFAGGEWRLAQKVRAPDPSDWGEFGTAVALHGNLLVVGAYEAAVDGEPYRGVAYVFEQSSADTGHWEPTAKLTAGQQWCDFGWAVVADDGLIVVGAPAYSNNGLGAVYVYRRAGPGMGAWEQVQVLHSVSGVDGEWFGWSLALNDRWLLVGRPGAQVGVERHAGAADLFRRGALHWAGTTVTAGAFEATLSGQPGVSLAIEVSTNLPNWMSLTNVTLTNATTTFRWTLPADWPRGFFRAHQAAGP